MIDRISVCSAASDDNGGANVTCRLQHRDRFGFGCCGGPEGRRASRPMAMGMELRTYTEAAVDSLRLNEADAELAP